MSPNSAPRCSISAMAVAMMVMSVSAASADMGRVANEADAEERFSAVDKAITWGYNGGRALQADWCSVVSESESYCCGFGARASCMAHGLGYHGPDEPCEVRLVTDGDGKTTCEGLQEESGYAKHCNNHCDEAQEGQTVAPALALTMAPNTEAPAANATMAAEEGQTVAPAPALTMAPNTEAPAANATMAAEEGQTVAPAQALTMAPNTEAPDANATMAAEEGQTVAPAQALTMAANTEAPNANATMAAEEGQTVAPAPAPTMAANTEAPHGRRHLRDGAA